MREVPMQHPAPTTPDRGESQTDPAARIADPVEGPLDAALLAEIAETFLALTRAAQALRRADPATQRRLNRSVAALAECGQAEDSLRQRADHVREAAEIATARDPATRGAAAWVVARQVEGMAQRLAEAGEAAGFAFSAAEDWLAEADACLGAEAVAWLEDVVREGGDAASRLSAAADALMERARTLEGEAQALAGGMAAGHGPASGRDRIDLGWMEALYTMDDERRVHAAAVAAL